MLGSDEDQNIFPLLPSPFISSFSMGTGAMQHSGCIQPCQMTYISYSQTHFPPSQQLPSDVSPNHRYFPSHPVFTHQAHRLSPITATLAHCSSTPSPRHSLHNLPKPSEKTHPHKKSTYAITMTPSTAKTPFPSTNNPPI